MKIYAIKIDAMPYCQEVLALADMCKGKLKRQISGCYTGETMVQFLTGRNSSDLEPRGKEF